MAYKFNPFTGTLDEVGAGGGTPGGSDTQVQFNDAGAFAGDADLTWNKTTNVLGITGDVNLSDGGTYTTTLQTITPTAARTISFPDATGTVALVGGSANQITFNNAGAQAGVLNSSVDNATGNITLGSRFISSLNGALSATGITGVPVAVTGTWIATGGTATTTKPQVLIEPTGTSSGAWSPSGTGLGVNAASGFEGNLLDLQLNGTSNFNINSTGRVSFPLGAAGTPSLYPGTDTNTGFWSPAADTLAASTGGAERLRIDSSGRLLMGTTTSRNVGHGQEATIQTFSSVPSQAAFAFGFPTAAGAILALAKSRSTAINTRAIVVNGDTLGDVRFAGDDGVDLETIGASISAAVDGTPGANDMPGRLVFSTTADGAASPTERMRIDSTGLVTLSGPGIKFPATQVASADPNTLDDYEEGTFSPTIAGDSTVGVGTYDIILAKYIKIGKLVYIMTTLNWIAHTGTGNMFISGLPFIVRSLNSY
ncbi:MAG: hypothetical protein MUP90_13230, partial [Gammaproteobacteria bacterium]|nr:hypothetical protein [Gammaproteobacteria bacterium]